MRTTGRAEILLAGGTCSVQKVLEDVCKKEPSDLKCMHTTGRAEILLVRDSCSIQKVLEDVCKEETIKCMHTTRCRLTS